MFGNICIKCGLFNGGNEIVCPECNGLYSINIFESTSKHDEDNETINTKTT